MDIQAHPLHRLFYPESIAIIGASPRLRWINLRSIFYAGYQGKIYPVNPRIKSAFGLRFYPSLLEIPDQLDYATVSIPAKLVPKIVEQCAAKGVKFLHILSSGFKETGTPQGQHLENQILEKARGITRIIGPNCLGIYCPESGLSYRPNFSFEPGKLGFISQSGGYATSFIFWCEGHGMRFSKVVSYGNACDLDAPDFLDYLAQDPKTALVAGYLEGVKQGSKFIQAAREVVAAGKPLVIWKAGFTPQGARAVASHTGAMVGESRIWRAALDQAGAIQVNEFEELCYTCLGFYYLSPGSGNNLGYIGMSGGGSVAISDICYQLGLNLPRPSPEIHQELSQLITQPGVSLNNPIDLAASYLDPYTIINAFKLLIKDPNMHWLILDIPLHIALPEANPRWDELFETSFELLLKSCIQLRSSYKKPILVVLQPITAEQRRIWMKSRLIKHRFPVFSSAYYAASTIAHMLKFRRKLESIRGA